MPTIDLFGVAAVIAAIGTMITSVFGIILSMRQTRAAEKLQEVHVLVNSQADLMKRTLEAKGAADASAAHAEGKLEGHEEERANPMVRAPIVETPK